MLGCDVRDKWLEKVAGEIRASNEYLPLITSREFYRS